MNKMSLFKNSINDSGNGTFYQNDELNDTEFGRKLPNIDLNQHLDTSDEEEEILNEANSSQNATCKLFFDESVHHYSETYRF